MRIQVIMKLEKLMKWTVFLQVRPDVVQKTQLITPPPHSRTYGETSFIEGIDEHTPLIRKENELNDSVDEIKRKFPNADTSKFASKLDEFERVKVS